MTVISNGYDYISVHWFDRFNYDQESVENNSKSGRQKMDSDYNMRKRIKYWIKIWILWNVFGTKFYSYDGIITPKKTGCYRTMHPSIRVPRIVNLFLKKLFYLIIICCRNSTKITSLENNSKMSPQFWTSFLRVYC